MAINKENVRRLLKQFNFRTLFIEELGWDSFESSHRINVKDISFTLEAVAQKRGVQIFVCQPGDDGQIPDYNMRRKIENQVVKIAYEHLIIYIDTNKTTQRWQWVSREPGKPVGNREELFDVSKSGEALVQKLDGIAIKFEEEDALMLTGVTRKIKDTFDREKVTKKFYVGFKAELNGFIKFLEGIPDNELEKWYASVMLNRLMFIYFIEKQGFLNDDLDYLKTKLKQSKDTGKDLYYREFLWPLFFEGFALKEGDRKPATRKLLGKVPYLNGGLFLKHQIEKLHGKDINIPDKAFTRLFTFFDKYKWHLDDRPIASGDEINPEILGYIFEKYTNQKQMGAYYTKEDITEYIGKNTIIPYIFDEAKRQCKIAFDKDGSVWKLLQDDPDRYIFDAVRCGVINRNGKEIAESDLPDFVQQGMHDPKARMFEKRYNLGDAQFFDNEGNSLTLPTETWREYVERRKRCLDLRSKLGKGDIQDINDLITYNLDIRQFAQDIIVNCEGPELLRAFWKSIKKVTVLDPTCGSGAFLFAALSILEPLYDACLDRMQAFIEELDTSGKHHPEKFGDFRKVLDRIKQHPNRRYFILKSIIINNLYGVDIMEEATEICKLRLFLKLAAQLESPDNIEPLPDIDFNIRAGNTLVGYATAKNVRKAMTDAGGSGQTRLVDEDELISYSRFVDKLEDVEALVKLFRQQQTELDGEIPPDLKDKLQVKLKVVGDELNRYLATEYGVSISKKRAFKKWLESHKPFHWFVEFYGIMSKGGFDVIIGNPPYVEYSKVKKEYEVINYSCLSCGNIYAIVIENSLDLCNDNGRFGMIVQNSIVSTDRMLPIIDHIQAKWNLVVSNFDDRPAKLFTGMNHMKGSIVIAFQSKTCMQSTSEFIRWPEVYRSNLFSVITNIGLKKATLLSKHIPKIGNPIEINVLGKLSKHNPLAKILKGEHLVYCHRIASYFVKAVDYIPYFWNEKDGQKKSDDYKIFKTSNSNNQKVLLCILNSSIFYYTWHVFEDGYHCGKSFIGNFPCNFSFTKVIQNKLVHFGKEVTKDYRCNSFRRETEYTKTGKVIYDELYPKKSKPIIDRIDQVLAQHYGFTDEELDFIINYDIKYRMGRGAGNGKDAK